MATRLLSDDILACDKVNALSVHAELFYRRLFSVVDDFGRFDGRPAMLRAWCFPLRPDSVGFDEVAEWVAECEAAGLVTTYVVDEKEYIAFHGAGKPRAKTSNYPAPPNATVVPLFRTHGADRLVYFIHDAAAGAVKIGSAISPESRLRDLQTLNANRLVLLGTRKGGQPEEKRLHREFAPARVRGEWFAVIGPFAEFLRAEGLLA